MSDGGQIVPENPGGRGDDADDDYLTPVQANKIVASFLNPKRRFPFDSKVARFAIRKTIKNMQSGDGRISNAAVANLIRMEKLNQNDDLARLATAMGVLKPKEDGKSQININVGVQVVEADDWYGTRAAANGHIATSNGSSAADIAVTSTIQGGSMRPTLGENGHRTNGHS